MKTEPRITIVVAVHNEEKQLLEGLNNGYIDALKEYVAMNPRCHKVLFVNDGSNDGTVGALRKQDFEVISSHESGRNRGKGQAVVAGLFHAYFRHKADHAILLDADILNLTTNKIESLVAPLLAASGSNRPNMVIGRIFEGDGNAPRDPPYHASGMRALRLDALLPLFLGPPKDAVHRALMQGYGLEHALNHLIPKKVVIDTVFRCAPAYRKDPSVQLLAIRKTRQLIEERNELADVLKRLKRARIPRERITQHLARERAGRPHLQ